MYKNIFLLKNIFVRFLQLTGPYWDDWSQLGYNIPGDCTVVPRDSNMTHLCSPDAFTVPAGVTLPVNITHCEACTGSVYKYVASQL